ncbi:MAG: nucleoside phosphorylase [Cellulosilyticum sp.]|nr:nucleoside phosphorylase [Cellulosilyticum sp.]
MEEMIYQPHIQCRKQDAAPYAILPGDPARVDRVIPYLTEVRTIAFNREYKSIVGKYQGIMVMVVSTGIGGASMGIAVEELSRIGVHTMIRIGSCGALDEKIALGDLILVNGAVRDEGTSKAYIDGIYPAIPDTHLLMKLIQEAKVKGYPYHVGKARSHDSFYTDEEEQIDSFWAAKGILGSDMETAALFVIGGLRGVHTASILNTVVTSNGRLEEGINEYVSGESKTSQGEKNEILLALEALVKWDEELSKGRD